MSADRIVLDDAVFATIGGIGTLAAQHFVATASGQAQDADDQIIYETDTGRLFFDGNGDAAGGRVRFSTMAAELAITNESFLVV